MPRTSHRRIAPGGATRREKKKKTKTTSLRTEDARRRDVREHARREQRRRRAREPPRAPEQAAPPPPRRRRRRRGRLVGARRRRRGAVVVAAAAGRGRGLCREVLRSPSSRCACVARQVSSHAEAVWASGREKAAISILRRRSGSSCATPSGERGGRSQIDAEERRKVALFCDPTPSWARRTRHLGADMRIALSRLGGRVDLAVRLHGWRLHGSP